MSDPIGVSGDGQYTNRCACGWEVTGAIDDVVDATIDHGRQIHNMEATHDQVVAALLRPDTGEDGSRVSA
jgi:hypothetical protein